MVKLVRSENNYVDSYQTGGGDRKTMLIQVKNVAYNKQVYVHHSLTNGSWVDIPAHYIRQGNSTYELWGVGSSDFGYVYSYGSQFVLKYVVNGQTYWDNNNGANYTLVSSNSLYSGPMLGNDINVLLRQASISSNEFLAYIDVRNIAPTKNVTVTYTTNNWATSTTLNASYLSELQTGWTTFILFPNAYNIERWIVEAPVSANQVQLYVAYTVNGTTYYDNNYAANYFTNFTNGSN